MAGLKLLVEKDDRILVGDDIMVTVLHTGGRPQIEIDAPQEVKLIHVKADASKMFLNRKKREAAQDAGH